MPLPLPVGAEKKYAGQLLTVYEWPQKLYDGSTKTFECVTRPDSVTVIAFLDDKTILLAEQEQPQSGAFLDTPGGQVDPGETPEAALQRELLEETGYAAERFMLWNHQTNNHLIHYEEFLYVATGLTQHPETAHEDPAEKIRVLPTAWETAIQLSLKRRLRRGRVMLALLAMEYDPEQRARLKAFLSGHA